MRKGASFVLQVLILTKNGFWQIYHNNLTTRVLTFARKIFKQITKKPTKFKNFLTILSLTSLMQTINLKQILTRNVEISFSLSCNRSLITIIRVKIKQIIWWTLRKVSFMTNALEFVTGSTPKMKARDAFNSWQNGIVIITIAGIVALRQVSAFGTLRKTSVNLFDQPTPTHTSLRAKDNQLWTKGKALQSIFVVLL